MKKLTTKAIILRRVNYGEADRILTVIAPEQGKLSLFAKGARRAKSKLAGGLELFCVSDIDYIDGKSELKTIVSTRLDKNYTDVVKDINITMLAYDFLKRIDENTQETCDEHFYMLLENALESLSSGGSLALTKAWFYMHILMYGGLGINIDRQVDGNDFSEDGQYSFDYEGMGFVLSPSGQFLPKHVKFLRLLSKVDTPGHLLKVEDADSLADDITGILEHCTKAIV